MKAVKNIACDSCGVLIELEEDILEHLKMDVPWLCQACAVKHLGLKASPELGVEVDESDPK